MGRAELIEQALKLDPRERAGIATRLLESLDDLSTAELDALWVDEAERRDAAVEQGHLSSRSADQVIAGIKASLG